MHATEALLCNLQSNSRCCLLARQRQWPADTLDLANQTAPCDEKVQIRWLVGVTDVPWKNRFPSPLSITKAITAILTTQATVACRNSAAVQQEAARKLDAAKSASQAPAKPVLGGREQGQQQEVCTSPVMVGACTLILADSRRFRHCAGSVWSAKVGLDLNHGKGEVLPISLDLNHLEMCSYKHMCCFFPILINIHGQRSQLPACGR